MNGYYYNTILGLADKNKIEFKNGTRESWPSSTVTFNFQLSVTIAALPTLQILFFMSY